MDAARQFARQKFVARKKNAPWFAYLLECASGKLYTGITTDLKKRFQKHTAGKGAKFTKANRPSHMIAAKLCANCSEASKLERAIKRLTVAQKRSVAAEWPLIIDLPDNRPKAP